MHNRKMAFTNPNNEYLFIYIYTHTCKYIEKKYYLSFLFYIAFTISFDTAFLSPPQGKRTFRICMMGRSSEFMFWKEKIPEDPLYSPDTDEDATAFQVQRPVEDRLTASSPPSWKRAPNAYNHEAYSPLPQNYRHDSRLSPKSRLRAIKDARREIMEIVTDMPESSYELSLRDIVDDQKNMEEVQDKKLVAEEEKKVQQKRETRIPQKSQICRTESMGSETYLLKMFFPVFLSSKKKFWVRKSSGICHEPLSDEPEKKAVRDRWKKIRTAVKDYQKNRNVNRSTSDISKNKTSSADSTLIPCERLFSDKKCKVRGQGCLF